jgi:hypothetical protein
MNKFLLTAAAIATIGVAALATSTDAEARRFGGHGFHGHRGHGFHGHRLGFRHFHVGHRFHRRHFGWYGAPIYAGAFGGCTWVKRVVPTPYGLAVKWRPVCGY